MGVWVCACGKVVERMGEGGGARAGRDGVGARDVTGRLGC